MSIVSNPIRVNYYSPFVSGYGGLHKMFILMHVICKASHFLHLCCKDLFIVIL